MLYPSSPFSKHEASYSHPTSPPTPSQHLRRAIVHKHSPSVLDNNILILLRPSILAHPLWRKVELDPDFLSGSRVRELGRPTQVLGVRGGRVGTVGTGSGAIRSDFLIGIRKRRSGSNSAAGEYVAASRVKIEHYVASGKSVRIRRTSNLLNTDESFTRHIICYQACPHYIIHVKVMFAT